MEDFINLKQDAKTEACFYEGLPDSSRPQGAGGRALAGWSEPGSLHRNTGVLLTSSGTGLHNLTSLHHFLVVKMGMIRGHLSGLVS